MTTTEQTLMNIAAKAWCSAAWARMAIEDQYAASTFESLPRNPVPSRCRAGGYSETERNDMSDVLKKLDLAMEVLTIVFQDTKATEVADALDILSAYREQYVQDNSQYGVGA